MKVFLIFFFFIQ